MEQLRVALCFKPDRFELRNFNFSSNSVVVTGSSKGQAVSSGGIQMDIVSCWVTKPACKYLASDTESNFKMTQTTSVIYFSCMLISEVTRHSVLGLWRCQAASFAWHPCLGQMTCSGEQYYRLVKPRGLYSLFFKSKTCSPLSCSGIHTDMPKKNAWWLPKQANFQNNVDPIICPDVSLDFSEPSRD